jgi:hypothetical protein
MKKLRARRYFVIGAMNSQNADAPSWLHGLQREQTKLRTP